MFPFHQRTVFAASVLAIAFARTAHASHSYDDEDGAGPHPEEPQETEDSNSDDVQTSGLTAPDAMPEPEDTRSAIEKELDEADRKDAGRGLEFAWLDGSFGYQYLDVTGLRDKGLIGDGVAAPSGSASTISFGGAAGIRLLYFSLGARFRYAPAASFRLWTLGGELGLRVPLGALEPYAVLGIGYAHLGGLRTATDVKVSGVGGIDVRVGGGVDYYLSRTFSVGGQFVFDYLAMSRPAQGREACPSGEACSFESRGTGSGFSLAPSLVLGLHF